MQYTVPHYWNKFQCTGGSCPDTCCAGWQIQIDPASLKKYRNQKGPLGSRLHNEINWKEACFRQYHGRCAFLNEENLCDLYLEGGGKKAFCRTCRTYPRHIEEFEGLREMSLSLSCPAAAKLILECREPVRFLHGENDRTENYSEFDFFLFTKLMDVRSLIFQILQERERPLRLRLALVLALTHDFQLLIRRGRLFETEALLKRCSSPEIWEETEQKLCLRLNSAKVSGSSLASQMLRRLFSSLEQMEVLRPDWRQYRKKAEKTLMQETSPSPEQLAPFQALFSETVTEQLMIYFLFTYFSGAVYDGDAWGKMKFSFASMVMIRELFRAECLQDRDTVTAETLQKTAWRFARELEHSDQNRNLLEQKLKQERLFSLTSLFSLLP